MPGLAGPPHCRTAQPSHLSRSPAPRSATAQHRPPRPPRPSCGYRTVTTSPVRGTAPPHLLPLPLHRSLDSLERGTSTSTRAVVRGTGSQSVRRAPRQSTAAAAAPLLRAPSQAAAAPAPQPPPGWWAGLQGRQSGERGEAVGAAQARGGRGRGGHPAAGQLQPQEAGAGAGAEAQCGPSAANRRRAAPRQWQTCPGPPPGPPEPNPGGHRRRRWETNAQAPHEDAVREHSSVRRWTCARPLLNLVQDCYSFFLHCKRYPGDILSVLV